MQVDFVLACLLIVLGTMILYVVDERTGWTPRLAAWLTRVIDTEW